MAHEWAHVAGYADESEANLLAWLICVIAEDEWIQYAGWIGLYRWLTPNTPPVSSRLHPQVRRDNEQINARIRAQRVEWVERLHRRAYDGYLKSNGMTDGVERYALFVRLVLGCDLSRWVALPKFGGE